MGKQMVRCPRDERVARPSAMIHLLPMRHRGSWPFLLVMSAGYRLPPKISVDQEFFIRLMTQKADLVLDPFSGSGTTLLVAQRLGRHYLGIDVVAKYVAMAERRMRIQR